MTTCICFKRYIHEARSVGHCNIFIPCELREWFGGSDQFLRIIQPFPKSVCELRYTLPLVHMPSNWRLLFIDIEKLLLLDDGCKVPEPRLLQRLQRVHGVQQSRHEGSTASWTDIRSHIFGMPSERELNTADGSGSCGMGVILAALDFSTSSRPGISNLSGISMA